MRKLLIGMALASTALATPAFACDGSWYVEADGGAMIVENLHFDINDVSDASNFDLSTGYDFGGVIGYDFGMFRLETEASYRRANEGDNYRIGAVTVPEIAVSIAAELIAIRRGREKPAISQMRLGEDELRSWLGRNK